MGLEKKVNAITPKEIIDNLDEVILPVVIQAVNNLLKTKFRGKSVTIKSKEIIAEIKRLGGPSSKVLYDTNQMDFEPIFRVFGWEVSYDRPGYNESYDSYYEFTPKK